MTLVNIDPDRLLTDLYTLRQFGGQGTGVVRPSLSPEDLAARQWLVRRMGDAGLAAQLDGVGNAIGRSPHQGPGLLVGSHSDSQPTGGWLDGALGTIYGLEVARACVEANDPRLAVDAVAWIDEEGTFGSCLGSRSFCGLVSDEEIKAAQNSDGLTITDAWTAAGLDGVAASPEPGRYRGYVEAHIEQGANLEREGNRIGVVTGIVGSRTYRITFSGQQNHAGTTPMPLRRDAGMGLIQFAHEIDARFGSMAGDSTVWTVGHVGFDPGAASIIAGKAKMSLQFRDSNPEILARFEQALQALVDETNDAGVVGVETVMTGAPVEPTAMDEQFQQHIADAAESQVAGQWVRMPSAAVHDAMFLAQVMPAAMLFVPSIGGISHDFTENTSDDDIVTGCQVLAEAIERILT